jgi:phage baseplate assembly protein W
MSGEFLGVGWRFPLLPDESGGLGYVEREDNVEQSLLILLQTLTGERVMRHDFGCRAPELVFAPGSLRYLRLLEQTVGDAIRDWEPRVDVDEVRAETAPEEDLGYDTRVTLRVDYRVRRTNTRHNLVFPFYVGVLERP